MSNIGDFGAKTSLFRYLINQKRNYFIKHCSPPCINKPPISEMYIYIRHNLYKWGLDTRGGDNVLQTKNRGEVQLTTHEIRYYQRKITSIVNFFDKSMKFRIIVVHDLTNNISYDVKLKRSKIRFFGGKIVKIMCKNREKLENICIFHICWYIGIKFCTVVVNILNKDIIYDTKLKKSKN